MADQPSTSSRDTEMLDRRTVLRAAGITGVGAAGAGVLAACGGSGSTSPGAGGAAASSTTAAASPYKVADIPVGGGKAYPDVPLVITQPTAGEFKAFNGTCTHQGCPVTKVENGKIICPCHESMFDITSGEPTSGSPAKKALAAMTATVSGDSIAVA